MSEPYPTFGGTVTKGEVFTKILHHIDELRNLFCTMGHLYKLEDDRRGDLLAKGWFGVNEMFGMLRAQIVELGKGRFQ